MSMEPFIRWTCWVSVVGCHAHALSLPVDMQGFDKGTQSKGQAKTRFRKAPKTENVYIKLLVKVSSVSSLSLNMS